MWYKASISQDNIGLKGPFQFSLEKGDTREILIHGSYYADRYEMMKHSYETDKIAHMIRVGGNNILFLRCNLKERLSEEDLKKIKDIRDNDNLIKYENTKDNIVETWNMIINTGKVLDFIKNDYKILQEMCIVPVETVIIETLAGSETDNLLKERFALLGELQGIDEKEHFKFYTKVI